MESLNGLEGAGPSLEEAENHGYTVISSCPSTSRALSIPHIRERIVSLAMSPKDISMSSFCRVRAVGRAWQETAFEVAKNLKMYGFSVPLTNDSYDLRLVKRFFEMVTPKAWLPLKIFVDMNQLDVSLATRLAQDYSHIIVSLYFSIGSEGVAPSGLDKKLQVFQGRDLCRLTFVTFNVSWLGDTDLSPVKEIQKILDAIERLCGRLTKLEFKVLIGCHFTYSDQLVLSTRVTKLYLSGRNSICALVHPRNTFPRLKLLRVLILNDLEEANLYGLLESSEKLQELEIRGTGPPLNEAPMSLPLPQLNSLKEIILDGINYAVETRSGSDVLPNLTTAELSMRLKLEDEEVARLDVLGRLLRNATRFTLKVSFSRIAHPRMEAISVCFSNVTTLDWTSNSGLEELVHPLSPVFQRMTSLQEIRVSFIGPNQDKQPLDLFRFLTGLQEYEIPEEEQTTILNGRRDVVTNLCRLRSLRIRAEDQFRPLSPILFEAVFNSMPQLTEIRLRCRSMSTVSPFPYVQEMVDSYWASGRIIVQYVKDD